MDYETDACAEASEASAQTTDVAFPYSSEVIGLHSLTSHVASLPSNFCSQLIELNFSQIINKLTPEKRSMSEPTSAQKKKKTQHKKTLAALSPDSDAVLESSAQSEYL